MTTWRNGGKRPRIGNDHVAMRSPAPSPLLLEETILALLDARTLDATICPSEAARAVGGKQWRELMQPVRDVAGRLVARGDIVITQGGQVVDGSTAKGPIRLRRVTRASDAPP